MILREYQKECLISMQQQPGRMILREYQKECLISMQQQPEGRYVIVMSTGLGKTCVFTEYINRIRFKC